MSADDPEGDGLRFEPEPAASGGVRGPVPLAERMRPRTLDEVEGQESVLAPGTFLREAVRERRVPSIVLWGPPGTGKTTIARALAASVGGAFVALSAVTSGVKDVRLVIDEAQRRRARGGSTILFVDEIHRFNKAQQDAFLPHVEAGTVVLVGATTENPAFALTRALLSRLRTVVLVPLGPEALGRILDRALEDPARGLAGRHALSPAARSALIDLSDGDARRCLNALEGAAAHSLARGGGGEVTLDDVREGAQRRVADYDRAGDRAYDALSAFHKSLRGSDPDAALFWMARMLEGGEDPLVVVRRMVAMAFEDVGLADVHAARVALEAKAAVEMLGLPEGELGMVRAVVYLATAPKSNAVVLAMGAAHDAAKAHPSAPVPLHLRNAPTDLAKSLGHGEGYLYPHDHPNAFVAQDYLPEALAGARFYEPVEVGDEREVARRLAWWRKLRESGARPRGGAEETR
ncbi:MAG TPA: replication-associated recombination protein A [Planctomycetota bacterium]|nr:replication-associated recombination protein A [Planctomycetota bacterium]